MPIFGNAAQGIADHIIGLTGQALTLTRRSAGTTYSPATGVTVAATQSIVKGAVLPYESFKHSGFRMDPGTNLIEGDLIAMISPVGPDGKAIVPPQTNDQLTVGSNVYSIVAVTPHAPSGVDLLFMCGLRGSA